jgi:hypothetical protein
MLASGAATDSPRFCFLEPAMEGGPVRIPCRRQTACAAMFWLLFGLGLPIAEADGIAPSYSITDLGAGGATLSAGASGDGIVIGSNGQSYAFPQAPNTTFTPSQATAANLPLFTPAPYDPLPINAFSFATNSVMNSNGIVAATDNYGVYGHWSYGEAYYVQHNADGSWGQPVGVFQGNWQSADEGPRSGFNIVGISNSNDILINNFSSTSQLNAALAYNISTHTLTDLFTVVSSAHAGFIDLVPIAIDNDGRILLEGRPLADVSQPLHTLLLTPDGVSSSPLESPVPEPGALAVLVMAIAGIAAKKHYKKRRRLTATSRQQARVAQPPVWP